MEKSLFQQLEEFGNEAEVRRRLASAGYHTEQVPIVQEWLRSKEAARAAADAAAASSRAAEQDRIAGKQRTTHIIAASAATIAAAAAIISAIISVMNYLHK